MSPALSLSVPSSTRGQDARGSPLFPFDRTPGSTPADSNSSRLCQPTVAPTTPSHVIALKPSRAHTLTPSALLAHRSLLLSQPPDFKTALRSFPVARPRRDTQLPNTVSANLFKFMFYLPSPPRRRLRVAGARVSAALPALRVRWTGSPVGTQDFLGTYFPTCPLNPSRSLHISHVPARRTKQVY